MTENNRVEYKRELTDGLEKEVVALLYSLSNDLKATGFQFLHD